MKVPGADTAWVHGLIARESPDSEVSSGSIAWLQCLCRAATRALPVTGAAISVMVAGGTQGLAAASDTRSELVEELQFTLGEGPCLDARSQGRPVLVPDLAGESGARWPAYTSAAMEHGVEAVFAFPMRIGAVRLGVLDMYRARPGVLPPDAFDLAQVFTGVALTGLLDAHEVMGADRLAYEISQVSRYRVEVYHAQGMLQVQLGVGPESALLRLRAEAYLQGRRLGDVARDIVDRKLTLERDEA
ncbi:GAF domain-containing protein [Kineosporia sp. NBRC 101731]|nr:GAF domain-containing protein [Kineosporia sp. NBRC 101731]